jgi:hypothetical protein
MLEMAVLAAVHQELIPAAQAILQALPLHKAVMEVMETLHILVLAVAAELLP